MTREPTKVGLAEVTSDMTTKAPGVHLDSRVVDKQTGVDELVVFKDEQMIPQFLLLFDD